MATEGANRWWGCFWLAAQGAEAYIYPHSGPKNLWIGQRHHVLDTWTRSGDRSTVTGQLSLFLLEIHESENELGKTIIQNCLLDRNHFHRLGAHYTRARNDRCF